MFNINEFLNYATDGQMSAPARKTRTPRKQTSVTIRTKDQAVTLTNFTSQRVVLPSGPITVHTYQPAPETITAAANMPVKSPKPALELVHYSDRSFAIFGDTRQMQDQLERLGGTFNRWLKREGKPTPGYIFSIRRIESVRKALSL